MNSSNSFKLELWTPAGPLYQRKLDSLELPFVESEELAIEAETEFRVSFQRTNAALPLRFELGTELLGDLSPGVTSWQSGSQAWFWNEFGQSVLRIRRVPPNEDSRSETIVQLPLAVRGRPSIIRDYRVMLEDLRGIHEGIAQDVLARSHHRYGVSSEKVSSLQPDSLLQTLESIHDRLAAALPAISEQPSAQLVRKSARMNYRGGERIDSRTLQAVTRDAATSIDRGGRVRNLGRIHVRRPEISQDISEHRHIAQSIRDLASRTMLLGELCRKSIDLLKAEQQKWCRRDAPDSLSVYEQRDLPRVERLEVVEQQATLLADRLRRLIGRYEFLRQAGPPRSPFGPTPIFLNRPAYRAIYETLLAAKRPLGTLVDGDALRISYRNLATLYEYWCFMKVVDCLRTRFGRPEFRDAFALIDDVYRPELAPGQEFQFEAAGETRVVVRYTPEFLPLRAARLRGEALAATLTGEPLRPDVTVEVRRPDRRPLILVLDAKSTESFVVRRFREISDYSRQIVDWRTGYQPVRQMFLLHRGRGKRPIENVPGYLQGRNVDRQAVILGAIECRPEHVAFVPPLLATVVDRFLAMCGVELPERSETLDPTLAP